MGVITSYSIHYTKLYELVRPMQRLKVMDTNGLLRRTLMAWFKHNVQPIATAKALYIHRNTLARRALQGTSYECLAETLLGPSLLAFALNEPRITSYNVCYTKLLRATAACLLLLSHCIWQFYILIL